ncbi:putative NRPS-like protein biosynthetic cluster [Trichoderma virens FT-333]|nr:putative NRPS-like protein biosynthetic cluster [Trichoderma virens FT-333]
MAIDTKVLALPTSCEKCTSPAIICPVAGSASFRDVVSYAQLASMVRSVQIDLALMGITKASRVALVLPNGLEFVAMLLAVLRQRGVAAPLNPQYTQVEFRDAFSRMNLDLVLILADVGVSGDGSSIATPARQAAMELGVRVAVCHRTNIADGGAEPGLRLAVKPIDLTHGNNTNINETTIFSPTEVQPQDKALMLLTSGTTGAPKLVLLSHMNILISMRIIIANSQLSSSDRTIIITPLHHITGVCGSLLATLFSGGSAVIPDSLPGAFWQRCADYGITWFYAVPTLHHLLLNFPRPNGRVPSQLRFLRCGGGETQPDLYDRLTALGLPLLESYGMTEIAPAIFCNRLTDDGDIKKKRRGYYPIPDGVDVVILPSNPPGQETGDFENQFNAPTKDIGVIGEVCLRGDNIMEGYSDNPEANAEAFLSNGYFRTGDLGAIHPGGYLQLVGRIKEVINKGGTKIGPAEVEHIALTHNCVEDAACFRIADQVYGDEIGLAITLYPHVDEQLAVVSDLKRHIRQHLSDFKVPKKIFFVKNIPYSKTGKLMRTQLSEQFAKGLL